jgi:serine/threonine-protein kinase
MSDPVAARLDAALEGRYRIRRKIGEGGMATVYLADDQRHGRSVAIKVLRPELTAVVGGERFLAEIRTTAALQHPHILPLHDSGETAGFLFYVMPWVEGESLADRLGRERQLPVDEAVEIAARIANALQYAHEHGVIHRDIKPANILLSRSEPLVADFGIALAVTQAGAGRLTETGLSLGTPHYMSPEQTTGERTLDPRSDVYSLGCLLYEMLTGEPPHTGPTSQAVLTRILTAEPPRASTLRRTVPPHVDAAVARALEKLPADRFASAAAFARALADPSFRHSPAARIPASPRAGKHRLAGERIATSSRLALIAAGAAGMAILVALALGGAALLGLPGGSSVDAGLTPTARFVVNTGGRMVLQSEIDLSPDGSHLVFATDGAAPLYLRRLDELDVRPIQGTEGGRRPAFSPDGEWIAYAAEDGIRRVAVGGGPSLRITTRTEQPMGNLHWGDDGSLVFARQDGIFRVPIEGGIPQRILEGLPLSLRFPRLLPGGEAVLFTQSEGLESESGKRVRVLDLGTGDTTTLVEEGSDARYVETGHLVYGVTGGTLFAVPFDLAGLAVTGPAVPVLEGIRVLPGYGATAFAASRTGTVAYVAGLHDPGASRRLVITDSAGQREVLPIPPAPLYQPRFSPDGRRLAYVRDAQIFVYDLLVGTNTPITSVGLNNFPVWTPGGDSIVFASARSGSLRVDLFRVPATGEGEPDALWTHEGDQVPESWASDGMRLLYTDTDDRNNEDLMVLDLEGTPEARPWLTADWDEWRARVSPDDRWVAYESDESGTNEVYARSFPDAGPAVRVSEGSGRSSRWSPDGRALYYWKGDTLMEAGIAAEPSFRVLSRTAVLTGSYDSEYDVRPDGRGFVLSEETVSLSGEELDGEAPDRLVVVMNWFAELTRRVGGAGS